MLRFLLPFLLIGGAMTTKFTKCLDKPPPLQLNVVGCDTPPCSFVKGKETQFSIDILANDNINNLTAKVLAIAMGTTTDFHLPQPNACLSLTNGECPLDAGEEVTYALGMPIDPQYPSISLILEFSLVSEKGVVACFKITAAVVDS